MSLLIGLLIVLIFISLRAERTLSNNWNEKYFSCGILIYTQSIKHQYHNMNLLNSEINKALLTVSENIIKKANSSAFYFTLGEKGSGYEFYDLSSIRGKVDVEKQYIRITLFLNWQMLFIMPLVTIVIQNIFNVYVAIILFFCMSILLFYKSNQITRLLKKILHETSEDATAQPLQKR